MRKPLCRTRAFGSLASTDLARPGPRVVDQWTRRLRAEIPDLIADLRVCQPALDARLQADDFVSEQTSDPTEEPAIVKMKESWKDGMS